MSDYVFSPELNPLNKTAGRDWIPTVVPLREHYDFVSMSNRHPPNKPNLPHEDPRRHTGLVDFHQKMFRGLLDNPRISDAQKRLMFFNTAGFGLVPDDIKAPTADMEAFKYISGVSLQTPPDKHDGRTMRVRAVPPPGLTVAGTAVVPGFSKLPTLEGGVRAKQFGLSLDDRMNALRLGNELMTARGLPTLASPELLTREHDFKGDAMTRHRDMSSALDAASGVPVDEWLFDHRVDDAWLQLHRNNEVEPFAGATPSTSTANANRNGLGDNWYPQLRLRFKGLSDRYHPSTYRILADKPNVSDTFGLGDKRVRAGTIDRLRGWALARENVGKSAGRNLDWTRPDNVEWTDKPPQKRHEMGMYAQYPMAGLRKSQCSFLELINYSLRA